MEIDNSPKNGDVNLRTDVEDSGRLCSTGVPGLDDVLGGGLTAHRMYLLEGPPGAGKTTIALQFLMEGARQGESVLYVTLSETIGEIEGVGRSHGWDLSGIRVREMLSTPDELQPDEQYTMFHPSEVELGETTLKILKDVVDMKPTRVVFDSLSELHLLAGTSLQYRRQILALKQFFQGFQCTVLMIDDMSETDRELQVQTISHAVIRLEQLFPDYGAPRRRLVVVKYRGKAFRGGFHDYRIERGGLEVFPRLVAGDHAVYHGTARVSSGVPALDNLFGGGLEQGTSTLIIGAAGTGKSTIAAQFALAAARRGEHAALFIFDESVNTLCTRCAGLGMDIRPLITSGHITITRIDPGEMSPGELVHVVRLAVTRDKASVVVVDSLNGYLHAMPDERFLIVKLHELLTYLGQAGVVTLLVGAQRGLMGTELQAPVDAGYLADAVVMLRYFEAHGAVQLAISVIEKRGGMHDRTIRAFSLDERGLNVGEPLRKFRGILTGLPVPLGGE